MKSNKIALLSFITVLIISCSTKKNDFNYTTSSQALLANYHARMFYEYQSPLNDEMNFFLELLSSDQFELAINYDSILSTINRVKVEKPLAGGYYTVVPTERDQKEIVIVVEWDPKDEVFVHILTDSSDLINYLP